MARSNKCCWRARQMCCQETPDNYNPDYLEWRERWFQLLSLPAMAGRTTWSLRREGGDIEGGLCKSHDILNPRKNKLPL